MLVLLGGAEPRPSPNAEPLVTLQGRSRARGGATKVVSEHDRVAR